jgi:SAM-dependent MidA family methyltransferase
LTCISDVHAAIVAAGGALRFDEFMRIVLYGDHGFYTSSGQAGRRGDFITSPEVGPLFGAVLARWIDAEWCRLGEPDDFTIVECGAGPGTLARSVLAVAPQWRGRYVAVEVSEPQRRQHPDGVLSSPNLPDRSITGAVIANELLDNLPFRLAVFDGGWREVVVSLGRDGGLVETTIAPDAAWHWLPATAPHGARLPLQHQAASWVSDACGLLDRGAVVAFDYYTTATVELAARPWREWLRTYRAQGRGEHYLRNPGGQDITAQVCIDQLPGPTTVELQGDFLTRWGIDELVEEGRGAWAAAAARPDVTALTMRSRVREAEALLDQRGLGGFYAVSWLLGDRRQASTRNDEKLATTESS